MAARLTAFLVIAIVTATLVAGLMVGAQRDTPDGPVDLIVVNGKVFPADGGSTLAEAVAIRGNQILKVGSNRDIKRLRRRQTTVVDARGGSVLPGLIDAHAHIVEGGLSSSVADLSPAKTLADFESALTAFVDQHPEPRWARGRGWNDVLVPAGGVARDVLDRLVPDRPTYLLSQDGHSAWVNSKALEIARITSHTRNPQHGTIVRDPESGQPTGILRGEARRLVEDLLPKRTREERLDAIRTAVAAALRLGVTSIHSVGDSVDDLELYAALREAGDLQVRIYSALRAGPSADAPLLEQLDRAWQRFPDDPVLKTGAVALAVSLDGVAPGLRPPPAAPDTSRLTPAELKQMVTLLDARGWQILVDAPSEEAVRVTLDAFEQARQANGAPARGRRHRIERLWTVGSADVARFASLGVIASTDALDAAPETPDGLVGHAQPATQSPSSTPWPLLALRDSGVRVVMGSDWPSRPLDPLLALQYRLVGRPASWSPTALTLDLSQAAPRVLRAYTSEAAYASFDETRKGRLVPGMLADLIVLSTDVFGAPPETLADSVVTTTIFDGKVVYAAADDHE